MVFKTQILWTVGTRLLPNGQKCPPVLSGGRGGGKTSKNESVMVKVGSDCMDSMTGCSVTETKKGQLASIGSERYYEVEIAKEVITKDNDPFSFPSSACVPRTCSSEKRNEEPTGSET